MYDGEMLRNSYKKLLEDTRRYYKNLKKIRCKHIDNDFIIFGDSGFSHLLIKDRKLRSIDEQFRKLFLIKYIPQIINSNVIKKDVRIIHSKEYGQIEYMALSRKIDERIVKMILRKIGSGNYHFWSIMDR